jgi:hypothetical protein
MQASFEQHQKAAQLRCKRRAIAPKYTYGIFLGMRVSPKCGKKQKYRLRLPLKIGYENGSFVTFVGKHRNILLKRKSFAV